MILEASTFLTGITPIQMIERWVNENKASLREPAAMSIATVDKNQMPSSRVVLAREFTKSGIIFYTNYQSAKGENLQINPKIAGSFFWDQSQKQIRFQGETKKLTADASDKYWNNRLRDSQLSQWVSQQSKKVASREQMDSELKLANEKFKGVQLIPRPPHWGGYEIKITQVEFWIGHPARFHDRFQFSLSQDQWSGIRLYP